MVAFNRMHAMSCTSELFDYTTLDYYEILSKQLFFKLCILMLLMYSYYVVHFAIRKLDYHSIVGHYNFAATDIVRIHIQIYIRIHVPLTTAAILLAILVRLSQVGRRSSRGVAKS